VLFQADVFGEKTALTRISQVSFPVPIGSADVLYITTIMYLKSNEMSLQLISTFNGHIKFNSTGHGTDIVVKPVLRHNPNVYVAAVVRPEENSGSTAAVL